ncbi:hypothetical protein [Nisaea sp.]|uniref:hypothetical protein n=1 Tax=Nisaea sp. TaxID=2024842 RepID=UPI003267D995
MFDALVQKIFFLMGGVAVTFCAGYGLYSLWEENTMSGRCFSAERRIEQHKFGIDLQNLMNLADQQANRKRTVELCSVGDGACFSGYAHDLQAFCNSATSGGG